MIERLQCCSDRAEALAIGIVTTLNVILIALTVTGLWQARMTLSRRVRSLGER